MYFSSFPAALLSAKSQGKRQHGLMCRSHIGLEWHFLFLGSCLVWTTVFHKVLMFVVPAEVDSPTSSCPSLDVVAVLMCLCLSDTMSFTRRRYQICWILTTFKICSTCLRILSLAIQHDQAGQSLQCRILGMSPGELHLNHFADVIGCYRIQALKP